MSALDEYAKTANLMVVAVDVIDGRDAGGGVMTKDIWAVILIVMLVIPGVLLVTALTWYVTAECIRGLWRLWKS